jgi:hypothetical protein
MAVLVQDNVNPIEKLERSVRKKGAARRFSVFNIR